MVEQRGLTCIPGHGRSEMLGDDFKLLVVDLPGGFFPNTRTSFSRIHGFVSTKHSWTHPSHSALRFSASLYIQLSRACGSMSTDLRPPFQTCLELASSRFQPNLCLLSIVCPNCHYDLYIYIYIYQAAIHLKPSTSTTIDS